MCYVYANAVYVRVLRVVWFRAYVQCIYRVKKRRYAYKFAESQLFSCTDRALCGTSIQNVRRKNFPQHGTLESIQFSCKRLRLQHIHLVTNAHKPNPKTQRSSISYAVEVCWHFMHACMYSAEQRVIRFFSCIFLFVSLLCRVFAALSLPLCALLYDRSIMRGARRLILLLCGEQK